MKPNNDVNSAAESGNATASRRRDLRFAPPEELRMTVRGSSEKLTVLDISLGGLGVESAAPLRRDVVHTVTLTLGPTTIVRRARAVHCRRRTDGRWVVGMAFVDEPTTGPTVESLIDTITGSFIRFD